MTKEIWLGPVLGSNRERLLARCAEFVSAGKTDRLLYIAASHPLLDLVTEKLLDGATARGVWGEFPVYLFRGFVRRVLSSARVSSPRVSKGSAPDLALPDDRATDTIALDEEAGTLLVPRVAIDREELPLRRSLISQIIKQLGASSKLKAIRPLANRDGCVNTIATLIGEIQRAGKTPSEFQAVVDARASEFKSQVTSLKSQTGQARSQLDFDREVALIYSSYVDALDRFGLTDDDADQLRALQILRGEVAHRRVSSPWLETVELLVLDGFFDFTPVQGEMLHELIATVPNVIVNVNFDQGNEEIFQPFRSTIEQLKSTGTFETKLDQGAAPVSSELEPLRERLFNSEQVIDSASQGEPAQVNNLRPITLFECGDRETEVRAIAKEIKRLILEYGYKLSEIALVVRERAAYSDTILRVCADESIPCNLERRVEALQVPAVRACAKLFSLLREPLREHVTNPKASELAHMVKTGYFRVSTKDLLALTEDFDSKYLSLLAKEPASGGSTNSGLSDSKLRSALGIGRWSPDVLENVIAYVGSELRVRAWTERALRLIEVLPSSEAARSFMAGNESTEGDDPAATAEREPPPDDAIKDKRKRPTPVHPAAIAWTVLVMEHLRHLIANTPDEGSPEELRAAAMTLLERLEFSTQVSQPLRQASTADDIAQTTLDIRGLESLRRAFAATVRSFEYAEQVVLEAHTFSRTRHETKPSLTVGLLPEDQVVSVGRASAKLRTPVKLSSFVDEAERCLRSQALATAAGNRDGLRVLEATDVRGLRFRAVFIAGMIEGGFPLRTSRDWLYPHEERERLRKDGIFLEDISADTLLKEEHYFYQAACRATDRLYLTRPLALKDGSETVASYYIEELRRAIAPAEIETRQIRSDVDTQEIAQASTVSELAVGLVRQQERQSYRARSANLLGPNAVAQLVAKARASGYLPEPVLRRVAIELQRTSESFGPFDGQITNADLQAMLDTHYGSEHVYSASGLSAYGNCAFRFFASRVLRLEPRNEAALDLQAIDAGKLLHDVLRRFFERYRNQYLPSLDPEELRREMARVADQVFAEHERMVPPLNQRIWKIDCEIRKLILEQVLLFELRLQEKTSSRRLRPTYFELAFGRASQASDPASSLEYLRMRRPGALETALVQGQIDRVDVDENQQVAIAYDYKLSQGAKLDDIEAGRQVQIPIYLAALEQLFVPGFQLAGGGYYRLRGRGPRLNQGLYRRMFDDCTDVTSRTAKLDDIEWQRIRNDVRARVWQFIDGMRAGDFRVRPSLGRKTCEYCDYAAVCRYEPYRINRKRSTS